MGILSSFGNRKRKAQEIAKTKQRGFQKLWMIQEKSEWTILTPMKFGILFISPFSVQSQTELRWIQSSYQRNWHVWSETKFSSSTVRFLIFSSISLVQIYVYYANLCIFGQSLKFSICKIILRGIYAYSANWHLVREIEFRFEPDS